MVERVKILVLLICFLCSACSGQKWLKKEKAYATTFVAASVIDWGQTRDIVKKQKDDCVYKPDGSWHCDYSRYERTNFLIGKNPSMGEVDTYFPIAIGTFIFTSHVLPRKWRQLFQEGWTVLELGFVHGNYQVGLDIYLW